MKRLQIVHEGVIYRNPLPGHVAICAYHPNLVPLSDDRVLCFYRRGQAMYSLDGRIMQSLSTDGGRTWQDQGLVWGAENETEQRYAYTAPSVTCLRYGRMIMLACRFPALESEMIRFNADTGGLKGVEVVMLCSQDAGQTWSPPRPIDLPGAPVAYAQSPVIELADGSWFLGAETWKAWDDTSPLHAKGYAIFSRDEGNSWQDRIDYPSAADTTRMFSHSQYRTMRDGGICATQWAQSIGGQKDHDLHFVRSDETATNWTAPQPTGLPGQTSCIGDLGDDRFVVTYSRRASGEKVKPGIMVALSEDGARTWNIENQAMVWDPVGQEYLDVTHKPTYPASHDNIAFGKPEMAVLPCGDIIATWWCTQACVTHVRCARLTVV